VGFVVVRHLPAPNLISCVAPQLAAGVNSCEKDGTDVMDVASKFPLLRIL
jgi:hypothetical protein